ncbi:hypothetical protein L9F63_024378 [Diploptera punctata]|uniref:Uncharacterized protein n=1 Tax=Diploptera punctata TaxID=6984 RepID=A0AAD7ZI10_DIPPU|nr:hypothetical protein L9F63_024378 [Diploptera punctata]
MQGSGNVNLPYGRQTERTQDGAVGLNRGYSRQMDQGMHDASGMNQGYGRQVDQGYHDMPSSTNRGFGRQMDQSIQDTGNINRSFGRQTHDSMTYNQGGMYNEHKDSNFGRNDSSSSGRYCHSENESGTNRNYHGGYEDNWPQNQGYRGSSRVGGSNQGHGENVSENRNYQQQFKSNPHGMEKHSISDNSNRDQRNTFPDFNQRQQQHQQSESPSFRSDISDSALNDSGIEILPLPTPSFSTSNKNTMQQQAGNMNTQGKTSLKNYRHNTFNAQLQREIESHGE